MCLYGRYVFMVDGSMGDGSMGDGCMVDVFMIDVSLCYYCDMTTSYMTVNTRIGMPRSIHE